MFSKRDLMMLGLVVLTQIGLIAGFWGLQTTFYQPHRNDVAIEENPSAVAIEANNSAKAETTGETEDQPGEIEPIPAPPGHLLPASFESVAPLVEEVPVFPAPPTPEPGPVAPDIDLPPLPEVKPPKPAPIPDLPPAPALPPGPESIPVAPPLPVEPLPPLLPKPAPDLPTPVLPGPPSFESAPVQPLPPADMPNLNEPPIPAIPVQPIPVQDIPAKKEPLLPVAVPSSPLPITPTQPEPPPMVPSVIKMDEPPLAPEGPSPWQFKVEIIDQRTCLFARTEKGATFLIRCDKLNLSRPGGNVEAVGKVEISGNDLTGSCDRLLINWSEDRLLLLGNGHLKRSSHGELLELRGPELQFHLSNIRHEKY